MTSLLLGLSAYVAGLAVFGPQLMRACRRWQRAAPRLGLVFGVALPTSWIVAVLSIGLAATAQLSGGLGLAGLLHACLRAVQVILGVHTLADAPAAIALTGSLAVVLRLAAVAARQAHHNRRKRNSHRRVVCNRTESAHHEEQRICVVDDSALAAYCVPGRNGAIVVTTGVLRGLQQRELDAVIAHEQAHLRGRHHLCTAWASVLARAFPFVPLLRATPGEIARLVEWLADDHAGNRHGRHTVARALATMATPAPEPAGVHKTALPATGSDVLDRVRRLVSPSARSGPAHRRIVAAMTLPAIALTAAAAAVLPAATADPTPLCRTPITAEWCEAREAQFG
ncbi:M56 family metallopeptidase [Bounagaea algeriensis]